MTLLRSLSIFFSIAILYIVLWQQTPPRRNGDKLLVILIAVGLFSLGVYPDWVNSFLALFSFTPGNNERIIGLLLIAVFFCTILALRNRQRTYALEHTIDRLVNALAKEQFRKELVIDDEAPAPIWVVIPAYNEAENMGAVLEAIPDNVAGLATSVIVVVDGGTDETDVVVRRRGAKAANHVINRGGGAALHAGYDLALEYGAQFIVTLDADGQHLPGEMERILEPILQDRADMVNGSRVLGEYEQDQLIRAWGVVFFNRLISILARQKITDCSNAYRAISAETLADVRPRLRQRQFHSTELLLEVIKANYRVVEVPITIKRRLSGESKKGSTVRYAWGFMRAIITTWLR